MQHNLFFSPYKNERLDRIYNLQFCDILELHEPELSEQQLLKKLIKQELTNSVLESLAMSGNEDSRVRILAFNQMRQQTLPVPLKILLGVIIEVGLGEGLEIVSVFEDERVRYISAEKRLAVVESPTPEIEVLIQKLLRDSQNIINGLSPSTENRHHPPTFGRARFTFIASDGIYLGEGQFKAMQDNPQAAELIDDALNLLHEIIITGSKH